MQKNLSKFLVLLFLSLLLFGCSKSPDGDNSQKTKLLFVTENYAPLNYSYGGKPTGMAVDVINAMGKVLGVTPEIKVMLWKDAYEKALTEPNVVLFSVTKIKSRADKFNWLEPSLIKFKENFYEKAGSEIQMHKIEDAKKYTVGTTADYYSEEYLKDLGFTKLKSYATQEETFKALMRGEVDLVTTTTFRKEYLTRKLGYSESDIIPVLKTETGNMYIVISKGTSDKVVDEWQKAFNYIRENKTYYKIYKKWFLNSTVYN